MRDRGLREKHINQNMKGQNSSTGAKTYAKMRISSAEMLKTEAIERTDAASATAG